MAKKKTRRTRRENPTRSVQPILASEPKTESKIDWSRLLISSPKELKRDLIKTVWVSAWIGLILVIVAWWAR